MVQHEKRLGEFGRNLRLLRKRAGLSQYGLADKSGVSRVTITRLENGRSASPDAGTVEALATGLGCAQEDLWRGPVGFSPAADAIEAYVKSDIARVEPPTLQDLEWLRGLPAVVWVGFPPLPAVIYHLIRARREALRLAVAAKKR